MLHFEKLLSLCLKPAKEAFPRLRIDAQRVSCGFAHLGKVVVECVGVALQVKLAPPSGHAFFAIHDRR